MTAETEFAASRRLFESVVDELASTDAASLTHSQLEDLLGSRIREVTRQLFQDHLRLRELTEQRLPEAVDASGGERTRIERSRSLTLATVFGKVMVTRIAYRGSSVADLHPADAVLNLPAGMHSHVLAKLAAIEASRGSFAEACERINAVTGAGIGHRQVQELAVAAAADIDDFYDALMPAPCTDVTTLVISVDGKGVVIRPEALREATAKAAVAKGGNKMKSRLAAGEKHSRKRMATLAAVYDAEPAKRGVDDIITDPDDGDSDGHERRPGPKARSKWLTGSVDDIAAQVVATAFDQAEHRDPTHRRCWVVLVDGARHQLDLITAEAERRGVTVHIVIDLIHVLEYLWDAAWCLHQAGDPAAEAFVAPHAPTILGGGAEQVAAALQTAARAARPKKNRRKGIDDAVGYLRNKAAYLCYDTALERGWPIATRIIEGACRHLVKDRLDNTGARWGLAGAEAVLKLRALRAKGDFNTYWSWHEKQEYARNHQARYRDQLTLTA
ncbi:ISKra4 family transposase [Streptomyces cynarae]|uniref:ISKra4 family transposase n=1 Tax=Streptomyces cynarae TaxID=2981134 RepID=A0ABY6ECD1_9ACTN|nr:ISKra4 family transposase [Streptomyces cynarae]UXY24297.1 ISKra4 family transposase [Streptomyces cynarae]